MKFIRFWGPPIVWMAIIFLFSSRTKIQVSDEPPINFLFFKTLHVLEYAMLFVLYFRGFKNSFSPAMNVRSLCIISFIFTLLYAASDEFHQNYVPTREGRLRDVIIDALGASLSWYTIAQLLPKAPKRLKTLGKSWGII